MAKKILYKVTAYHCPRCGGVTEPTKTFCEYCERQLLFKEFKKSRDVDVRVLIDCSRDFVYFDNILKMSNVNPSPPIIDATMSGDFETHYIRGRQEQVSIDFEMYVGNRTKELFSLIRERKQFKTRLEIKMGFNQIACEMDSFVAGCITNIEQQNKAVKQILTLNPVTEMKQYDSAIPDDVLKEMRCPNCGAPVKSHFGACDYCGGWIECEW